MIFILLPHKISHSAEVRLKWNANLESDLAGYRLYYGTASRNYNGSAANGTGAAEGDSPIDVGNVSTFKLTGLGDKEVYYFALTAYDTDANESDLSGEVFYSPAENISPTEICNDGIDNDDDGAVDCDDSDCAEALSCQACVDTDSDGYYAEIGCGTIVDCDDSDLTVYPGATEVCDDNVDNDCGGAVDCADPDCQGDVACSEPVTINTPNDYEVADLQQGDKYYLDRDYSLSAIPAELSLGTEKLIKTQNADKRNTSTCFLEFTLQQDSIVYVAYDSRATSLPNWLDSFEATSLTIGITDAAMGHFAVYKKSFSAGSTVCLGGNMCIGAAGAGCNYLVIVQPSGPGPEICDNGGDDDEDGFVDLQDPDCACTDADSDTYYAQSWCGTNTDCADSDPTVYPGATEVCDDNVDNDCDGAIDCADSDCEWSPGCNITMSTPGGYEVADLQQGDTYYLDRDYTFTAVPAELSTGTERLIKTRNDDSRDSSDSFLQFEITHNSIVYVGYDSRATSLPNWLDSFEATSLTIGITDAAMGHFAVYRKSFSAGSTIYLGGNMASGAAGVGSTYIVIVQP